MSDQAQTRLSSLWKVVGRGGTILVSLLGLYIGYDQIIANRRSDEERFLDRAAEHKPRLEFVEAKLLKIQAVPKESNSRLRLIDSTSSGRKFHLEMSSTVMYRAFIDLIFENRSAENAVFTSGPVYFSFNSYEPVARNSILGDSTIRTDSTSDQPEPVWGPNEMTVSPGKRMHNQVDLELINGWTEQFYTVHVCNFYRNDFGNWYDIYCWIDVEVQGLLTGSNLIGKLPGTKATLPDTVWSNISMIYDSQVKGPSEKVYSKAESSKIAHTLRHKK